MSDVAIRVESLSKRYRLGERQRSRSLRESLTAALSAPFRRHTRQAQETIWALKDVSFEVRRGEVVGVIGRNGAGKSTLLKILSRITEPTSGRAEVHGRVGSLLEVGTGFHNELTGRENIYLNGAILGMKRAEIARKFDEIVAFAEVERFLDTPVKHYSSGMYLRLAFAVAAHLEPEILLVDEVLAVGDAQFQKKCLGKMGEVSKQGRTVLFVSHSLGAIDRLCPSTILLDLGTILLHGSSPAVIQEYLGIDSRPETSSFQGRWETGSLDREQLLRPVIRRIRIRGEAGTTTAAVRCGEKVTFEIDYDNGGRPLSDPQFAFRVETATGQPLVFFRSRIQGGQVEGDLPTQGTVSFTVLRLPLCPGHYGLTAGVTEREIQLDRVERMVRFDVVYGDFFGTSQVPDARWGPVLVKGSWVHPLNPRVGSPASESTS